MATPENEDFVRRFHEKYPQHNISDPMETAYIGVKLWAQAVNEAQSLDPKKIRPGAAEPTTERPGRRGPDRPRHAILFPDAADRPDSSRRQFKVVWTAPAPVARTRIRTPRTAEAWRAFFTTCTPAGATAGPRPRPILPRQSRRTGKPTAPY